MLDMNQQINDIVVIPLVHSVLYKERYKKLDVKKSVFNIQMKISHFSHQRSLATELTTFYLENKSQWSLS